MRQLPIVALWSILSLGIVGCDRPVQPPGGTGTTGATAPTARDEAQRAATAPVSEAGEQDLGGTPISGPTGRIEGTVRFEGEEIPSATLVPNGTDPEICGLEMSKQDVIISPENRGIRNVILWIADIQLPEGYRPPREQFVIDNVRCQFEPHAAVITVGSSIEARSSDPVLHTTHFYGAANDNPALPGKGSSYQTRARRPGLIQVKCDKHGWMQAFIRVDPHPFHAVSDSDGKFVIAGLPPGTYKLEAWHEVFRGQASEVAVGEDEATAVELTYRAEQ